MNIKDIIRFILITAFFLGLGHHPAFSAGLLKPIGGDDAISLKSHRVNVVINNGFARTEVDQVFINGSDADTEAIYSFPLPEKASLSELSLWIDGKEVIGEVMEKEKARKTYNDQAAQGNDTALAEKDEYRTFDISVYPVRANAETRVRLVYYQPLSIDLNIGRYVYPLEEGGVDEDRIAFWSVDNVVKEFFSFDLQLKSAFPVKDVRLPGYQNEAVITSEKNENDGETYHVELQFPEGEMQLSKDIVFYYRLDDATPARVELVPYRPDAESPGTFMLVITPGSSLQPISSGADWTFVLDISGSMQGQKIATLAEGVSRVIGQMSPEDRFRIVTFNDRAEEFSGGYINATPENAQQMIQAVKSIQPDRGTALYDGLATAYRGLDRDRTTGIVLVTDGVANVGPSSHADLLKLH